MPYRRYGKKKAYGRKRKGRTLAARSIKKRTSAKSQSKQIAKLARQVRGINKRTTTTLTTVWSRASVPIQVLGPTGSGTPYVCPIPCVPMDPAHTFTGTDVADTVYWTDNLRRTGATEYSKSFVFGQTLPAVMQGDVYHSGQEVKFQIRNEEPEHSTVDLFVVQPRKHVADDLVADRQLCIDRNAGGNPQYGPDQDGGFEFNEDYTTQVTGGTTGTSYFGTTWNKKWWKVLYHRTINLGEVHGTGFASNVSGRTGSTGSNAIFCQGTIRLPGAGKMTAIAASSNRIISGDGAVQRTCGLELGLADERNEDRRFLVAIQNGISGDLGESIDMALFVKDYYKVST